jgi:integrase
MPAVGRRRTKNFDCPPGVREEDGRWSWQPTSKRARDERRAAGLTVSVALGPAGSVEARKKWAALTGHLDPDLKEGTVAEILALFDAGPIEVRPNGRPRAKTTVYQYRWALPLLRKRFGDCVYGKTEFEASRGQAIGPADIQRFVTESGTLGRRYLAVMDGAFDNAIRCGRTVYNPCDKVIAAVGNARTREPQEWELECLVALATPVVALLIRCKAITGPRISEVLRVQRKDMTADGIRMRVKGGRWEIILWSPELRTIVAEAEALPEATRFPLSPLFPHSRRKAYTYSGFNTAFQALKEETNAALAGGVLDPDTFEVHTALVIEDLHIHDVRSKVHDDAEAMGREGHEAIGNTERVADKHYSRREKRRRPLR